MRIEVRGNYGGELMEMKFRDVPDTVLSMVVKVNGYAENNALRVHFLTTVPETAKESVFLLLPATVLPSYKGREAKVFYEVTLIADPQTSFVLPIEIYNNNLEFYDASNITVLEFGKVDNSEYEEKKRQYASLILNSGLYKRLSPQLKNNSDVENIEKKDDEVDEDALVRLSTLEKWPIFPCPNALRVREGNTKKTVMKDGRCIAKFEMPSVLRKEFELKISYLEDCEETEIFLYRDYSEEGVIVDRKVVFEIKERSHGCVERLFEIRSCGVTARNSLFSVEYTLVIRLGAFEVARRVEIVDDKTKCFFYDQNR